MNYTSLPEIEVSVGRRDFRLYVDADVVPCDNPRRIDVNVREVYHPNGTPVSATFFDRHEQKIADAIIDEARRAQAARY